MRKCIIFFSVLIIFLPLGAPISWAQEMIIQKGIAKMLVHLPEGKLTIYLPAGISNGEAFSGTILAEPGGSTSAQLKKNAGALSKYQVTAGNGTGGNASGSGVLNGTIPPEIRSLTIKVLNAKGETVSQQYLPVLPAGQYSTPGGGCQLPDLLQAENMYSIPGHFDGNLENTKCSYNDVPLRVLAEAGGSCVVKTPAGNSLPKGNLSVKDAGAPGGTACSKNIQLVKMEVSTGPLGIQKGTQTWLEVSITGLNSLQKGETAGLRIINQSTGVVAMQPQNQVYQAISGPADSVFSRRFNLTGIQKGDFSVDVNLDLPGGVSNEPPPGVPGFDLTDLKTAAGFPGSYGLKTGERCTPEGATIRWQWHRTFQCEIKGHKVLRCGQTKESDDLYDDIKELLEAFELDKPYKTAEKMAKAFSVAKAFSYSVHVVRAWVDYDIEYVCRGGVWQPVGGLYIRHGTDNLGWQKVLPKTFCWLTFSDPADASEFKDALETALRNACAGK